MYMSVIELDQANCLMKDSFCQTEEQTHKILLESLENQSRLNAGLLYRKDKNKICVYSNNALNQEKLFLRNYIVQNVVEIDDLYNQIQNGDVLKLFIKTVPSKKVDREGKKNSARIGLTQKSERTAWIERKLLDIGAVVLKDIYDCPLVVENGYQSIEFSHSKFQKNKGSATITARDYIVTVQITDRKAFLNGVKRGIGPYKSYGCGLILVGAA